MIDTIIEVGIGAAAVAYLGALICGDVIAYRWQDWRKARRDAETLKRRAATFKRLRALLDEVEQRKCARKNAWQRRRL